MALPLLWLLNTKKFAKVIIENWRISIILLMAFAIWYQNFNDVRWLFGVETIPSLEKRLDQAKKDLETCKNGNNVLSATIDTRNAEVRKWKTITDGLERDIDNLNIVLATKRKDTEKEVGEILGSTTPETCEKSIDYLRDARKDLQWKK